MHPLWWYDCAENFLGGVWHNMTSAKSAYCYQIYRTIGAEENLSACDWWHVEVHVKLAQKFQQNDQTSQKGQQNYPVFIYLRSDMTEVGLG